MLLHLHPVVLSQLTLYLTLLIRALFIYLATRSSQVEFCEWVCVTVQYQVSLSPGVTYAMMFCFHLLFLSSQEKKWAKRPWVWTQPVVTAISGRFGLILAFPASFSPSFLPSFPLALLNCAACDECFEKNCQRRMKNNKLLNYWSYYKKLFYFYQFTPNSPFSISKKKKIAS